MSFLRESSVSVRDNQLSPKFLINLFERIKLDRFQRYIHMMFSCNSQRQNMFRGADCFLPTRKISTKLCSKGFWDTRIDSQVRLASRLNIKVPYHALQASGFTEKFYGHLLPRKLEGVPLVFRLCCHGKDSLGYDPSNNNTHKADKELEARRSKDSMIDKVIDLSMALDDEAARAWIDVNQTFSAIQETIAEESWVKEAVQMATMEVYLAKARLHESLKAGDKEEAILYAQNVKEWLAKLTSMEDRLRGLQAKKDELLNEANMLKEAYKRAHTIALDIEEDITELMIWAERSVMSDAGDKTNERNHGEVLVREANELDEANQELEAIRSRNSMISKGIDQLISLEEEAAHAWNDANQIFHVVQEMIIEEYVAKEPVQKAVIVLSPGKESSKKEIKEMLENLASLQNMFMCLQIEKYKLIKEANRLSETAKRAQNLVVEAEEEVMEMMIWGEQAMTLEREAIRRSSDAKTALKIAEKSHGRELGKESTIVDEDVASRLKESYQ